MKSLEQLLKNALSYSSVSVSGVSKASDDSKDHDKKIEINLTSSEQSLMMSDDIIQCLFSAVENWEMMREKSSTSNLPVSTEILCKEGTPQINHAVFCIKSLVDVGDFSRSIEYAPLPSPHSNSMPRSLSGTQIIEHCYICSLWKVYGIVHILKFLKLVINKLCNFNFMQPVLALRCLDVLLTICTCHAPQLTHQLSPSYNNAVSLYNDLVLSMLGPRPHPLPKPHPFPSSTDLGRRELVEIRCSQMMADLALAQMQLACGGHEDTRRTLLSMLSEPVLEQASTLTFMFVAKAKLLASEILQQRTFDLRSSDALLHYIVNNSDQSGNDDGVLFQLTPLELAVDAVKIYQKLANHRSVKIEQESNASE